MLPDILKADIFFFVATIAFASVSIFAIILLGYLIRIAQDIRRISRRLRREADHVADDLEFLRRGIERGGSRAAKEAGAIIKKLISFEKKKTKTKH